MTGTALAQRTDEVRVLVVDDSAGDRKEIADALCGRAAPSFLLIDQCATFQQLEPLGCDRLFVACILDVRFEEAEEPFGKMLQAVRSKWPTAAVIILSNWLGELGRKEKKQADALIPKPKFKLRPALLRRELASVLRKRKFASAPRAVRLADYLESLADAPVAAPGKLLFEIRGYVSQIQGDHVEVVVQECGQQGEPNKRLLMRRELFEGKGILGEHMPFVYRMHLECDRIVSEVIPEDVASADPKRTPRGESLRRLEKIQHKEREG